MSDTVPRRVFYDGAEYPSINAAAKALGVWPGSLKRSIAKGIFRGKIIYARKEND